MLELSMIKLSDFRTVRQDIWHQFCSDVYKNTIRRWITTVCLFCYWHKRNKDNEEGRKAELVEEDVRVQEQEGEVRASE